MQIDNDFRDLLHQKKTSKLKIFSVVTGIILLASLIGWGLFASSNETTDEGAIHKSEPSEQMTQDKVTPDNFGENDTQDTATQSPTSTSSGSTTYNSTKPSGSPTNNNPSSDTKPYDPSKCEHLNAAAVSSKQVADQKKTTYDQAFAARKNYGYYYDKNGNSVDAQREYNAQEALLSVLQKEWSDALTASNSKYTEYQECRSTL